MGEKKQRELWTFEDLQNYLKIPRSTLFLYIATDKIPYVMVGRHRRFFPDEVEKAVRKFPK